MNVLTDVCQASGLLQSVHHPGLVWSPPRLRCWVRAEKGPKAQRGNKTSLGLKGKLPARSELPVRCTFTAPQHFHSRIRMWNASYVEWTFVEKDLESSRGSKPRGTNALTFKSHLIFSRALRSSMPFFSCSISEGQIIKGNVPLLYNSLEMKNTLPEVIIANAMNCMTISALQLYPGLIRVS